MQKLKELIKLSNFQLFASNIEGHTSHQKLRNCWVAKKLIKSRLYLIVWVNVVLNRTVVVGSDGRFDNL